MVCRANQLTVFYIVATLAFIELMTDPGTSPVFSRVNPANIYMFKFNNGNTRKMCEISLKLPIKTIEQPQGRRSGVFIGDFEHISYIFQVFLFLTLNR